MLSNLHHQTRKELHEIMGELGPEAPLLIISNLTVIVLALVQGWDLVPLLWVYWCQSIIIGFFNWLRMRKADKFTTKGLKAGEHYVQPTKESQKKICRFFLLHYGAFHLFYFLLLFTITDGISREHQLSMALGGAIFFFNHLFSYRGKVEKDKSNIPDLGTLMFFPYLRIIPMHLVMFAGQLFGRGSTIEILIFLLLKTGADLLTHIIEHVNWKEPGLETPWQRHLKRVKAKKKGKKISTGEKIRLTLKQRLKLWFLLAWVGFLALILFVFLVMNELERTGY